MGLFPSLATATVVLLWFAFVGMVNGQSVPVATASSSSTLATINGNSGHIAANSVGDSFYVSQGSNTLYWLPRGATTPVAMVTGLSGGRNTYVDAQNNVFVPSTYGGTLIEIPYVGGTYATNVAASSVAACTSANPSTPCSQGSAGSVLSYYYQPLDMSTDAAGNLYVIDAYPNGMCTAGDCIVEFPKGTSTYGAPVVLQSNITGVNYNAQIAAAPNGDVYFASGTTLYYLAAGTSKAITVGTFTSAVGVSTDRLGNVYVTTNGTSNSIYEIPALNGVAQQNLLFPLLATYSANGVALDGLGDLFYTGYNGGSNLNVARLNSINVGQANVGTAASATATSVQFTFSAATTVASINSTGSAFTYTPGSCAAGAYAAGSSCTVNVAYTPSAVGFQRGAVNLTNASGAALSTALLFGQGLGAAETNDPGTVTAIGSGFTTPRAVRVDGAGNVFVADAGQNAVLRYAGGSGTPTSIGTGLSKPSGIAFDGAGNVFIADAGNGRVVEVPNVNGTLTNASQTVIANGLGMTLSIATDHFGNLLIADGSKTTITRLGPIGGVPSTSATTSIGSKFAMPYAITTDRAGNVFVADYSNNSVSEIAYLGLAQSSVGAGLSQPSGLATDAAGSLYIADSGNARLLKIPLENGSFNTNDQYLVGASVAVPFGVALDATGNLYVTDISKATVSRIDRTAGTLPLGRAQIGTATAASNIYVGSSGTATLTLGTPNYVAVSAMPTYFNVSSPSTTGCSNGQSLGTGFACILSASFAPTTTGSYSDLLTFTSNAVNSAALTENITGTGLNLTKSTTTLTQVSPAGTASFGQPVTIQATITSTLAGSPSGNVTFSVDGATLTNPPTVTNGLASVTLQNLTGGSHTITASYTGDNNYAPSVGTLAITVAKATSSTTLAISGITQTPPTSVPGSSVTLTATVVQGSATAPTGGVTFTVGSQVLNATPVALANGSTGYTATLATTALPIGSDTITATYTGDVNYSSSSGSSTLLVSYQTFTVTPATASVTVTSGQTATIPLTVTSLSGFASNTTYVGLVCSGLPANSACAFNPQNFLLVQTQPQPVTMQILTGQTPQVVPPTVSAGLAGSRGRVILLLTFLSFAPLALLQRSRFRGRTRGVLLTLALVGLAFGTQVLTGCGSQLFGVTPSGTYTVKVTSTASVGGYSGPTTLAAGCSIATDPVPYSSPTTELTCVQTTSVTLVVK